MDLADRTILSLIESRMLRPDVVTGTIAECLRRTDPARREHERKRLEHEILALTREITNLTRAIALGQPPQALLSEVATREIRVRELQEAVARLTNAESLAQLDLQKLEAKLRAKLTDFQGLASRHVQQTRQILRLLVPGRFTMTPVEDHYRFKGEGLLAPLMHGILPSNSQKVVTPAGFEPAISTLKGSRPWPG